jgi:hypothetical protein
MKYYRADFRNVAIEEVDVDTATSQHVYINGTPIAREQVGYIYFPTRSEAKESLESYYEGLRQGLEIRLNFAKQKIDQAKAL